MANKLLSMQKVRQILLFLKRGYSEREIVRQTGVSRPTIHLYSNMLKATGTDYDVLFNLSDHGLGALVNTQKEQKDELIDFRKFHFMQHISYFIPELKLVGVSRYLLWQEYLKTSCRVSVFQVCELLEIEFSARNLVYTSHINPPICSR